MTYTDPYGPTVESLQEHQNSIASRIPGSFDCDVAQEAVIDRWLDTVEERMRVIDLDGWRWLFLGGTDPRPEDER